MYDPGDCGQVGVICKGILPKTKVIVRNVGCCKSVNGFKISKNNHIAEFERHKVQVYSHLYLSKRIRPMQTSACLQTYLLASNLNHVYQ